MLYLKSAIFFAVLLCLLTFKTAAQDLGANFNENISEPLIRVNELKSSGVNWVRGFVNIPGKYLNISQGVITGVKTSAINNSSETAEFVLAKQSLGKRVNFVMSLKLPFENLTGLVPVPGTSDFKYVIEATETFLLSHNLAKNIEILVLGNEPMWENGGDAADYKIFLNAFADTVAAWKIKHNWDFMVFAGALNRVEELKKNETVIATMDVAKNNNNIDGIDLHVHAINVNEAENSFRHIREGLGFNKKMITTEFSMNRLLSGKTKETLGNWGSQNGYSSTMKMYEYLNHCKLQAYNGTPVSESEFLSFFESRSWYPQKWYKTMYDAFKKYGGYAHIGRFYAELTNSLYAEDASMWDLGSVFSSMYMGVDSVTGFQLGSPLVYPEFAPIRDSLYAGYDPTVVTEPGSKKLLFHFKFDNNLIDETQNKYELIPKNSPVYVQGKNGNCVELNGFSDFFDLNAVGLVNTGKDPFSVCAWVFNTQTVSAAGTEVIGNIMHQLDGRIVLSCNQSSTLSTLGTWIGGANYKPQSSVFKANQWQHVAAVFDPANKTHTFYVNGESIGTTVSVNAFEERTGGFRTGAHKSGKADFFGGLMDDLILYRGLLTQNEIKDIMTGDVVLSNTESGIEQKITLYPNPANDIVYFGGNIAVSEYKLFSMDGRLILKGNNASHFSVADLKNGLYLVELLSDNNFKSIQKIVVKTK